MGQSGPLGLIHTIALTSNGFSGPIEIDPNGPIHTDVINMLNASVSVVFNKL